MLSEFIVPRGGHNLLSATESVILYDWLKAKLPYIDKYLEHEVIPESECAPFVSPKLAQYLDDRRNLKWAHYHVNAGPPFFGCEVGSLSRDCFKTKDDQGHDKFPQTSDFYFSWRWNLNPNNTMRIIAKTPRATSYWIRSSTDGRYVGYGLASPEEIVQPGGEKKNYASMIVDLTKSNLSGSSKGNIYASGRYDPAFTPDGRGFMLHGVGDNYNAGICPISVLKNPAETTIEFNEAGCVVSGNVRTYQSLGSSLGGTDTYALTGTYGPDDAGGPWADSSRRDPVASWGVRSFINFTRMTFDGTNYQVLSPIDLWTPFSGDWTLSPSSGMAAARTAGKDPSTGKLRQLDYSFHALRTKPNGKLELERLLSVCTKGSKGTFSLDEQYFVYHHYVEEADFRELGFFSPNVPEFQAMLKHGTSNIYVLDLRAGTTERITSMEFGQIAAFPHFRADGWLYFLVRDQATKTEWLTGVWLDP